MFSRGPKTYLTNWSFSAFCGICVALDAKRCDDVASGVVVLLKYRAARNINRCAACCGTDMIKGMS